MGNKTHIMVILFPAQGHINPMLHFSKSLANKGLKITIVNTTTAAAAPTTAATTATNPINIESITLSPSTTPETVETYVERYKQALLQNLPQLITNHSNKGSPIKVLVYDSVMPWALDFCQKLNIKGAAFFTQSCAVTSIYYHQYKGNLKVPSDGSLVNMDGVKPILETCDLPSFINDVGYHPSILKVVVNQSLNYGKADWLFFNSFDELEDEVVKWMTSQWAIKTIGPAIPSMFLDNRIKEDEDYGLNLFKPDSSTENCVSWLDTKSAGSVVYISFGSIASLGENQMEELAMGLMNSKAHFLWVVRSSEQNKLPHNFIIDTSEKGLVVNWCPQLEVLAHRAVGCFVTHCGWNSTLESLSLGVPMIVMPQWTDQPTNAKYIADVWEAGVRVRNINGKGIASRDEIEICVKEVMDGEKGIEIKRNALRWKELARVAIDRGGSSDKNIDEFILELENVQ